MTRYTGSPLVDLIRRENIACTIEYPDATQEEPASPPRFTVHFRTTESLQTPANQMAVATAYMHGDIDVSGDFSQVMDVRSHLGAGTNLAQAARFLWDLLVAPATKVNRTAIDSHYTLGDDFYHTFIDTRYHFYSQCLFHHPRRNPRGRGRGTPPARARWS